MTVTRGGPLVVALLFAAGCTNSVTPDVVEGRAMPNANGTAISFHDSGTEYDDNSFVTAGIPWAGPDGTWHDGTNGTNCVGTDTTAATRVRLGIIWVEPVDGGMGGQRLAWLVCLE